MLSRLRRLVRAAPRTLPSVDAYALWAATYPPRAHNRLMEIEQEWMLRLMPDLANRAVLDLACGTGRYAAIAREREARIVVGADNSLPMLRGALRAGIGAQFAESTMATLPFVSHSFDVVVCGLALGHLPADAMLKAISEIARVLRSGGEALISDFHPFLYLTGGQRTFTHNGETYAVEHHPHLIADYFAALTAAGLRITALEEPRAALRGRNVPAVLVICCRAN